MYIVQVYSEREGTPVTRVEMPEADLLDINTSSYLGLTGGFCWGVPNCHLLVATSGYPGLASTRR